MKSIKNITSYLGLGSGNRAVLQDHFSECGLACIAYISKQAGYENFNINYLRNRYHTPDQGMSFYDLMQIISEIGIGIATPYRLTVEFLSELPLPAILHWDGRHFVVLTNFSRQKLTIMDPALGIINFPIEEAAERFSGTALSISLTEFKKLLNIGSDSPLGPRYAFNLTNYFNRISQNKFAFMSLAITLISLQLVSVFSPKYFSLILDEVIGKRDLDFLWLIIYIYFGVFLVETISSWFHNKIKLSIIGDSILKEGCDITFNIFSAPYNYLSKRGVSNLVRKSKSINVIAQPLAGGYLEMYVNAVFAIVFIVMMWDTDQRLATFTTAFAIFLLSVRFLGTIKQKSSMSEIYDAEVEKDAVFIEALSDLASIKLNRGIHRFTSDWCYFHRIHTLKMCKLELFTKNLEAFSSSVGRIELLVITGIGSQLVLDGNLTAGALMAFVFYKDAFMHNIVSSISLYFEIAKSEVETEKVSDIPIVNDVSEPLSINLCESITLNSICLKNVCFQYSSISTPLIVDLNLDIPFGSKVAILGSSGCGKSTLLKILTCIIPPTSGSIKCNDIFDIEKFGISAFYQQISLVDSNTKPIRGSIIDNITNLTDKLNPIAFNNALRQSNFDDVVKKLPNGLGTTIIPEIPLLSSGQLQRLLIARALYKQPRILFLDEPTSHLDIDSTLNIRKCLNNIDTTVIVATHDQSLIEDFDIIVSFVSGNITVQNNILKPRL